MRFCVIFGKAIEDTVVSQCIDCERALCKDCTYEVVHCFDCGGILCNNCDGLGLCQNCEVIMILKEDLFDEEI
jgi:hypothetical protein